MKSWPFRWELRPDRRGRLELRLLAETINGLYKTEVIRRLGPWRGVDQVEYATAEWVDWFNTTRLFECCGDVPPVELEQAHYHQDQPPTEAA